MSDTQIMVGLAAIVVLGVGAQSIARRRSFPSLLLLLPFGLLAGSVLDLVDPEELFGDTLFPGVTMLVGLLLFQSGLQLRIKDLPKMARGPVIRLTVIGVIVTFLASAAAVYFIIGISSDLSLLTGAILVVSGPTVIGPLLRTVRPREPTGAILRWEGTMLDPIGASLGVVVLNLVLASERLGLHPVMQMGGRLLLGVGVGAAFGILLVFLMSRFYISDSMEAAVALLFAVAAFTTAELFLSEAGLFATVVLGVVAANQPIVPTSRISGFGETLEVLIIGSLFIVLGALVDVGDMLSFGWRIPLLVAALVVVVRPVAVGLSMIGSQIGWRDRALIAWVDPRGVVAAATAAAFAGSLASAGLDADFLLPVVFGVVLGAGVVYGLSAGLVAGLLGVRLPPPQGVVLVGNDAWMVDMARCFRDLDVSVLLITSNPEVKIEGRQEDVPTASLLDPDSDLRSRITDTGAAKAVVSLHAGLTENLVTAMLIERLGRRHVHRVLHGEESLVERRLEAAATALAFGPDVTDTDVGHLIADGGQVRVLDDDDLADALVVAAVTPAGHVNLHPYHEKPRPDDRCIGITAGA
ncbi:MAG: hypothetical protein GY812_00485 [Actinomycetia bacterium]|nr:hypothetical protein [Actinomycetes bacterium]